MMSSRTILNNHGNGMKSSVGGLIIGGASRVIGGVFGHHHHYHHHGNKKMNGKDDENGENDDGETEEEEHLGSGWRWRRHCFSGHNNCGTVHMNDQNREIKNNAKDENDHDHDDHVGKHVIGEDRLGEMHVEPVEMEIDDGLQGSLVHDDDIDDDDGLPGSPVTASPPESPKGFIDDDEEEDVQGRAGNRNGLVYEAGVVSIPHPEKAAKGGEDAHFVSGRSMGVFDGVGGWASVGIDAGRYAAELAERVRREDGGVVGALEKAVGETETTGSSTACVVGVEDRGRRLVGVNVGDSGIWVIRDGRVVLKTREQQHYFNCPYQLGTDSMDEVGMGDFIDWKIRKGDWIVMATDGLWDNVFENEVVEAIRKERELMKKNHRGLGAARNGDCEWSVDKVAKQLAKRALQIGLDTSAISPFSVNAHDAGTLFMGGKLDDITVLVCRATQDEYHSTELYGRVVTRMMMMNQRGGSDHSIGATLDNSKNNEEQGGTSRDMLMAKKRKPVAIGVKSEVMKRLEKDLDILPSEPIDDVKTS